MRLGNLRWRAFIFVGAGLVLALLAFNSRQAPSSRAEPGLGSRDSSHQLPFTDIGPAAPSTIRDVAAGEWSAMSSAERTALLMIRFDHALERLEEDRANVAALEEARTVLSLLRSELMRDDEGRQLHATLEERLERLTEAP